MNIAIAARANIEKHEAVCAERWKTCVEKLDMLIADSKKGVRVTWKQIGGAGTIVASLIAALQYFQHIHITFN